MNESPSGIEPVDARRFDDDQWALVLAARRSEQPDIRTELARVRSRALAGAARGGPDPDLVEDRVLDGPHGPLRVRRYRSNRARAEAPLIYFHGGGMVLGSVDYCDVLCRRLCVEAGVSVVSVDYRLAPEHPFPIAFDEAVFATDWVVANKDLLAVDTARLVVGGDSAGGALAAAVALHARDVRQSVSPVLQLLIYPGLERVVDRPSMREFGDGPGITRATIEWMKEQYLGADPAADTPYGVPALAESLAGLPEALVVLAGMDPLRDGGQDYARRLLDAGVPTTVMSYPGVLHGFLTHVTRLRRADRCVTDIALALRARLDPGPSHCQPDRRTTDEPKEM